MNKMNERNHHIIMEPLTPNLEQYKTQNRNKTKKKNGCPNIQPTLPPVQSPALVIATPSNNNIQRYAKTPVNTQNTNINPSKANINSSNANHNGANIINNNLSGQTCQYHPDKKALYIAKDSKDSNKLFCGICAVTDGGGDSKFLDQQKYEKTRTIDEFKKDITMIRQSIKQQQCYLQQLLEHEQQQYSQYFGYISSTFKQIIEHVQQKHKEMNNNLIEAIQKRKQKIGQNFKAMDDIKSSVERYLSDINRNYQEIIQELSIQNFREVMKQYNAKVQYYSEYVLKKINHFNKVHQFVNQKGQVQISDTINISPVSHMNNSHINQNLNNPINVYVPTQEIRRVIDKANVLYRGFQTADHKIGGTRSLQKFMGNTNTILPSSNYQTNTGNQVINRNNRLEKQRPKQKQNNMIQKIQQKNDRKSQSKIKHMKKRNNPHTVVHQIRGANNNYNTNANPFTNSNSNINANKQNIYNDTYYSANHGMTPSQLHKGSNKNQNMQNCNYNHSYSSNNNNNIGSYGVSHKNSHTITGSNISSSNQNNNNEYNYGYCTSSQYDYNFQYEYEYQNQNAQEI